MEAEPTDLTTRRQRERDRLIALHANCPTNDKEFPFSGVLLSDGIKYCIDRFDLIRPFDPENLKPANYKLTIGDQYAMNGKICPLSDSPGENVLRIPPFQVAVIKTRETINMPRFLIARWNIKVKLAYEGLLWVGGPQVDAGYVGHLFCPVYNLSNKEVRLVHGDSIAVIDFVRTSDFHEGDSKKYTVPPERILFEDYAPEELNSALYEIATNKIENLREVTEETKDEVKQIQARVDTFVVITFAIIAVLFAAITIFAANSENKPKWDTLLFASTFVSMFALLLSGTVWLHNRKISTIFGSIVQVLIMLVLAALVGASVYQFVESSSRGTDLNELKKRVDELQKQLPRPASKAGQADSTKGSSSENQANRK